MQGSKDFQQGRFSTSMERFDPRQSFNKDHEKVRLGCFLFELVALVVQFL